MQSWSLKAPEIGRRYTVCFKMRIFEALPAESQRKFQIDKVSGRMVMAHHLLRRLEYVMIPATRRNQILTSMMARRLGHPLRRNENWAPAKPESSYLGYGKRPSSHQRKVMTPMKLCKWNGPGVVPDFVELLKRCSLFVRR